MKLKHGIVVVMLSASLAMGQQGEWEPWFDFGSTAVEAITAVHLIHAYYPGGPRVMAFGHEADPEPICPPLPNGPWASNSRVWFWTPPNGPSGPGNPGNFQRVPMCTTRLFCAGHSALADGRILLAGGDHPFNPVFHN